MGEVDDNQIFNIEQNTLFLQKWNESFEQKVFCSRKLHMLVV